jgi:hypothetical protein
VARTAWAILTVPRFEGMCMTEAGAGELDGSPAVKLMLLSVLSEADHVGYGMTPDGQVPSEGAGVGVSG